MPVDIARLLTKAQRRDLLLVVRGWERPTYFASGHKRPSEKLYDLGLIALKKTGEKHLGYITTGLGLDVAMALRAPRSEK